MTHVSGTIGVPISSRRPTLSGISAAVRVQSNPTTARHVNLLPALMALAGIIIPTEVQIHIAAVKLSPGRIAIVLLLFPALVRLCTEGRRLLLCDFLVFATVCWIVFATVYTSGLGALSAAASGETLDLLGGYVIARAYFIGPALDTFVRVLRLFLIIAVILGLCDSISGRLITHETIASLINAPNWPVAGYRLNMVRAASTFDHEILFGTFCALTAAILLYWEKSLVKRTLAVCLCLLGCIISFSSAALMVFFLVVLAYAYNGLMKWYPWRWSVFWIGAVTLILAIFVGANHPLSWILSHFTFNSQTGWYRIMIWDNALIYIDRSPMTGYGYELFHNEILDNTIDSVWLYNSLRFGVPMTALFLLANIAALLSKKQDATKKGASGTNRLRPAFTLVLIMFIFAGITVHFYNYLWMFWGICLGIRASFREPSSQTSLRHPTPARQSPSWTCVSRSRPSSSVSLPSCRSAM